jgi:hypothetical protein
VLRSQSQERDRLAGWDERVRNDTVVEKRKAGYSVTVDECDEDLTCELGRAIQRGEPANDVGFVCPREPQLDDRM